MHLNAGTCDSSFYNENQQHYVLNTSNPDPRYLSTSAIYSFASFQPAYLQSMNSILTHNKRPKLIDSSSSIYEFNTYYIHTSNDPETVSK